jgi:putative two-component system response regulator
VSTAPDIFLGKVLIVDDQTVNIVLLERMLRGAGYLAVSSTTSPAEVCELHLLNRYDLILLDLQMPAMDGFAVMERLKDIETDYLPVLVVTSQPGYKLRALEAGAQDFISKPFEQAEVLARVRSLLTVRLLHQKLHDYSENLEAKVRSRTDELQKSYLATISALTRAAEYKDEATASHLDRISYFCRELSKLLGMDEEFVDEIFFASPMHDVGKIGIPDSILFKPGALTPQEWSVMRGHAPMGYRILGDSDYRYLGMGAEIALNHHERFNGGGYPNGTSGESIPLAARIMSLCDTYDAVRSARPYKEACSHAEAMDIITAGDGRTEPEHFDPIVLAAFLRDQQLFCDIYDTMAK